MSENSRIFMHLTSPSVGWIKGECTVDEYEQWIELDSWNWTLDRDKLVDAKPGPSLLTVNKLMDGSTTKMLAAMLKSEKLTAKLVVDDGSVDLLFELSIELEELSIKDYSVQTSISEKGATVDEDWVFDYSWITFKHQVNASPGARIAKLERSLDAGNDLPGSAKKAEFKKIGLELLGSSNMSESDLKELWAELIKAHEEEKKRPGNKSLQHAGKKTEEDDG